MITIRPSHYAFITLSAHAKIHKKLDSLDAQYRTLLEDIERREITSYRDDATFEKLELLKHELLSIRFIENEKKKSTSPSP